MRKRGRLVLRNFRARFILRCTPFSVIPITLAISLMDIPSCRLRTKASLCLGSQFWGVAKGAVLTLLMMLCTWLCTKTKIIWLKDSGREDYFNSVISATLDQ